MKKSNAGRKEKYSSEVKPLLEDINAAVMRGCTEERVYSVYKHTTPSGKVYIGITSLAPKKRWDCGRGYMGQVFNYAIKKYGWDNIKHEILFYGLTKEQAEEKEVELIAQYKSNVAKYGYNVDLGGNSVGKMSNETKRKLSISKKGQNAWNKGKKLGSIHSEETKKQMSEAHKGQVAWNKGKAMRPLTTEEKEHLSKLKKGIAPSKEIMDKANVAKYKAVEQYTLNGEYVCSYESIISACNALNIKENSHIGECCRKPHKLAYGYKWKFAEVTNNE